MILEVGAGQTYATIQDGIDAASSGDTVRVHAAMPGGSTTYTEQLTMKDGVAVLGMAGDTVTVQSASSPVVQSGGASDWTIDGLNVRSTNTGECFGIQHPNSSPISGVTIRNLTIEMSSGGGVGDGFGAQFVGTTGTLIENVTINVSQTAANTFIGGISALFSTDLTIRDCEIFGVADPDDGHLNDGIVVSGRNISITDNYLHDGFAYDGHPDGIVIQGDGDWSGNTTQDFTIARNRIKNFSQGIFVDAIHKRIDGANLIASNIIWEDGFSYIGADGMNAILISGECITGVCDETSPSDNYLVSVDIYNNTIDTRQQQIAVGRQAVGSVIRIKNNILIAPGFTRGLDFTLTTGITVDYTYYAGANATPINWGGVNYSLAAFQSGTGQEAHARSGLVGTLNLDANYFEQVTSDSIGHGEDLSSTFTYDIDGGTRSAPWDMGADQFGVGEGSPGSPGGGGGGGSPSSPGSPGEEESPGGGGGGTTGEAASIYSDIDLQDPGNYYGGFKEARVIRWGIAERVGSDPYSGAWTGSTFDFETSDHDRSQRLMLQNEPWRMRRTRCVRMTNRPNRAELGVPWVVWIGPTVNAQPSGRLNFRYTLGDRLAASVISDKHQMPWRLIRDGFLDQLDEIAPTLDLEQPEPIIYGHHHRVPDVDPASGQGFELTPPLLGKRTVGGTQYYVWLIAGHACADVPRIRLGRYVGSPPALEMEAVGEGTEWLIPTQANHTATFGASYEDLMSSTFGVMRRYTLLYGVVGDGTTDPDLVAKGDIPMTVAVTGIETIGDGTGAPIIHRFPAYKHWMINFVANRAEDSYQSGPWRDNPLYPDPFEGGRPVIDEDSFDLCDAIAFERFPVDGYQVAAVIGARAGDRRPTPDYVAIWNRSSGCQSGPNHVGGYRVWLPHPTELVKAAALLYTDATEIGLDTFSCEFKWGDHAGLIPFRTDYEHISGQFKTNGVAINDASVAAYGVAIPGALREYQFAPGITAANHLAVLEGRMRANPPRVVGLETTVGPDEDGNSLGYADLGDYIKYRHFASVGDTIGEIRLAQIVAHQVQVGTRTVRVAAVDLEDLIGFDEPDPVTSP